MAQRVNIVLVDDLDGSEATENISFALDGTTFEIDLSAKNAEKLRADFAKWTEVARRSTGRRGRVGRPAGGKSNAEAVRAWAKQAGFEIADHGRIPKKVIEAYEAAN